MKTDLVKKISAEVHYERLAVVKSGLAINSVIFILDDHHDAGKAYGLSEKLDLQCREAKLRQDSHHREGSEHNKAGTSLGR